MKAIYIISSLRQKRTFEIEKRLRELGFDPFGSWRAAGELADDSWKEYEESQGRTYKEALKGYAAQHVFNFDKTHLNRCDAAVLVAPGGKSANLELGWMLGQGKLGFYLLEDNLSRWDVMLNFCTDVFSTDQEMYDTIGKYFE